MIGHSGDIGDRRASPRYEILGTLAGSLKVWHRLRVRTLDPDGALVETTNLYLVGTILGARLSVGGHSLEVRAEVRHVAVGPPFEGKMGYLVRFKFPEPSSELREWVAESSPQGELTGVAAGKRSTGYSEQASGVEMEVPASTSVVLRDLGLGGALFTSAHELERGTRAHLRARLGEHQFAAEVELLRVEFQPRPQHAGYRIGASFVSMDENNRHSLAAFLVTAQG